MRGWYCLTTILLGYLMLTFSLFADEIKYSSNIPSLYVKLLKEDLKKLKKWDYPNPNTTKQTASLLGIKKINYKYLSDWLFERIHYVIGENDKYFTTGKTASYPFPYSTKCTVPENSTNALVMITIMSNEGASNYCQGKKEKKLKFFTFKNKKILVNSPRVGIIRIGPGLFSSLDSSSTFETEKNQYARSISRLGTLYHEARHSDGHGDSVGFLHVKCPVGHDFAGKYACDDNGNGPYTIGAEIRKVLMSSCSKCSVKEKEDFLVRYFDSMDRVLKKDVKWNSAPEKIQI